MTTPWDRHLARHVPEPADRARTTRTGAVALMLVLVLTMLVGSFAISLSSRAAQQRNAEHHEKSIAILESAIDAVAQANLSEESNIRLPVDEQAGQWIEVERISGPDTEPREFRATEYRNDQPGLSIQRMIQ